MALIVSAQQAAANALAAWLITQFSDAVIISAKWDSVPPSASAITTAASLALRMTRERMAISTEMVWPLWPKNE